MVMHIKEALEINLYVASPGVIAYKADQHKYSSVSSHNTHLYFVLQQEIGL